MDFHGWMTLIGVLMLLIALLSAYLRNLPISTSFIYLIIGLAISSIGFDWIEIDFIAERKLIENLTEVAVIFSLFVSGLKLRLPFTHKAWRAAYMLAFPVMICSIAGIALYGYYFLGISAAAAVLLGAFLAPTDPVLASAIAVEEASDKDRMRYGLSGEAGFNDGAAFPFVIFGLMWLENSTVTEWIAKWSLHRLLWAIPAGLLLGFFLGKIVGKIAVHVRSKHRDNSAPNDFLALALIALSYIAAETIYAWGFLAVFAAGLGLRQTEIEIVKENPHPEHIKATEEAENSLEEIDTETGEPKETKPDFHPPAEDLINPNDHPKQLKKPAVAVGLIVREILSFGDTVERLLEILLVFIVGIALAVHWTWQAVPLALFFFFVIRPVFAFLLLQFTPTTNPQRLLMGWFGIRGIGSLYYVTYALNHGWNEDTKFVVDLAISTVALSIIIHGLSSQPILKYYEEHFAVK